MIERFVDDDAGFQNWLTQHAHGFVVNCYRKASPSYLVLHDTDCGSLTRYDNYTTKAYIKVCSDSRSEIETWARDEVGGNLKACGECQP